MIEYSEHPRMFFHRKRRDLPPDQAAVRDRLLGEWQKVSNEQERLFDAAEVTVKAADDHIAVVNQAYAAYFDYLESITQ